MLEDRSIWAVLLLLALPMALPIPLPGLSAPFGACMTLVSAQVVLGRNHAWLPARLTRRPIAAATVKSLLAGVALVLRRLEKVVRPRRRWMAAEWTKVPVGCVCLILAIIITLPIPLGHVVPAMAISLFSLGMMERDGAALWSGLIVAIAGIVLIVLASAGVYTGLNHWWNA